MALAALIGFIFGFVSAMPVAGPISALVFSRGLRGRFAEGRTIALGAGLAEGIYTFIAFWGFHEVLSRLNWVFFASNMVGALILFVLGIYFYRSKRMRDLKAVSAHEPKRYQRGFITGFTLTLINPSLIATWTAAVTTFYSLSLFPYQTHNFVAFSLGVAFGIYLWFSALLQLMQKFRDGLRPLWVDRGLKVIGIFLLGLSALMIFRLFSTPGL